MASSDVVILGGGFGGARAALVARESLESSHRVTLIDRRETMHLCEMNPMLVAPSSAKGEVICATRWGSRQRRRATVLTPT